MHIAFSDLRNMRSAYLAGIGPVILDFIIFYKSILFNHYFHNGIAKTI